MAYSDSGFFVDEQHLSTFGENTARSIQPLGSIGPGAYAAQVRSALRRLDRAYAAFSSAPGTGDGAAVWLLDNRYLAAREGAAAVRQLNGSGQLRRTEHGVLMSEMCAALVRSGCGEVTMKRCRVFLTGFQRARVLTRLEIGLIPCFLRCEIVKALSELYSSESLSGNDADHAGALFSSLRFLSTAELGPMLESIDRTEQALRRDPAGVYAFMDERTRDIYRRRVSRLAAEFSIPEHRAAERAVKLSESASGSARHVGYYLFTKPLGREKPQRAGGIYITLNVLTTTVLTLLAAFLLRSPACGALLLFPISQSVKAIEDFFSLRIAEPRHIPRMELHDGIPASGRTLCVITALITSPSSGKKLAERLELFRMANRDSGSNLLFGILADLPETRDRHIPGADSWMDSAADAINALNLKYGGGFFLFARERSYSRTNRSYMGRERKRGAIEDLAYLLRGGQTQLEIISGSMLGLHGIKYILTLDSDTFLLPGSARSLVGAMLHPLNRPVIDEKRHIVTNGCGLIHPRVSCNLESASRSAFTRIFAGQGGTDPYGSDSGEIYMDLFGLGGFAGKGIIDIDAYLTCVRSRLPEERVLSHDTLEGAYLHGGFMGDTELTDSFPGSYSSYCRREHRWIRGDWQNLSWLFRRGKELPDGERWRIFDNIRRSLVPVGTLLTIVFGFFFPEFPFGAAAVIAFGCYLARVLVSSTAALFRTKDAVAARLHSALIHGFGGEIMRSFSSLLLLPNEAFISFTAAASALWRMAVSKRNLLCWQVSSAADSAGGIGEYIQAMIFSSALGLACVLFSPSVLGKSAGVLWFFSPLFAWDISRTSGRKRTPSEPEKEYFLGCARDIWAYFSEFCTPEDHFLPPDNHQVQPPVGTAHRTSPTNIGLALVSALSAVYLGAASEHEALGLIENIISTVERMEKWHGHLYNWYDTRSLKTLSPPYVSAVDCGNLAACLTVTAKALAELDRTWLAERCRALLSGMDLGIFYDRSRRLLYIGIDPVTGTPSESWYDLLSSEARLTSYLAVARGDVPLRHWQRLSRALVGKDGWRGTVSWTGTMFEYLMPELFLPLYRNSLLYESAKFCLYVQKKRTGGQPWGISESAFFSLDPALSYRYKAHGCADLALHRGMDNETVLSPYSSFLALSVSPDGVMSNLQRLERMGMRGKYGFWEALDLTPERGGKDGRIVYCVMSHHLGMSMAAICNYLCRDKIRRLFMSDPSMASFASLLQERVPVGGQVLHRYPGKTPEKPARSTSVLWEKSGNAEKSPGLSGTLLSNGAYSIMLTNNGLCRTRCGSFLPYILPTLPFENGSGMAFAVTTNSGTHITIPHFGADIGWKFTPDMAEHRLNTDDIMFSVTTSVSAAITGEKRTICLSALNDKAVSGNVEIRFEPVLAGENDYVNHPAFFRLGINAELQNGALLLRRLRRGSAPECWLFAGCSVPADISLSPGGPRPGHGAAAGWLSYPYVTLSIPFELSPGGQTEFSLAVCIGRSRDEVISGGRSILSDSDERSSLPCAAAELLSMNADEYDRAMDLLPYAAFPPPDRPKAAGVSGGPDRLWRFGISGDVPIICFRLESEDQLDTAKSLIRRYALLCSCGESFDLVILTAEGGSYRRESTDELSEYLDSLGLGSMRGVRGGVHIIAEGDGTGDIISCARMVVPPDGRTDAFSFSPDIMSTHSICESKKIPSILWNGDGSFSFYVNHSLPPHVWGNMLSNGSFGFFAADCGTGHMWFGNAREMTVTPWINDPLAVNGGEDLVLITESEEISLFASPDDTDCRVTFAPGYTVWEKTAGGLAVRLTAFVPPDTDCRVMIIEYPGRAKVRWHLPLSMSDNSSAQSAVQTDYVNSYFSVQNSFSQYPDAVFKAMSASAPLQFTCSEYSYISGAFDGKHGSGLLPCIAAEWELDSTMAIVCGFDDYVNLFRLTDPAAAVAGLAGVSEYWRIFLSVLRVRTPETWLNSLINTWAPYQAMACRYMGRSSIYQSGGAFGFRDQLQDIINLLPLARSKAREHILRCCAHQYVQGDVMHWWHALPGGDRGVRTRCSDDLLWLPWAVCEYVEKTGDTEILSEDVPFLRSDPLSADESDRYETACISDESAAVCIHCKRAIDTVRNRGCGKHGLLLFGSGDWNDGMDKVGNGGSGESVWLSWFFSHVSQRFSALLQSLDDPESGKYAEWAGEIGRAAESAWDVQWYLRGYFDDGTPLGSEKSSCCRIDSVAQSFSVLCPFSSKKHRALALTKASELLFDHKNGILKLFDPPFSDSEPDPGYIQSYGPGFRENGGQYTHGAVWLAMAMLLEDRADEALEMLRAVTPDGRDILQYGAEPFVIAADVYSAPGHEGEAGWSWYTGSAGWFYRVCTEELLGLRMRGGRLFISPRLPSGWDGFEASWRGESGTEHLIRVSRGGITVDGRPYDPEIGVC